MRVLTVYLTLIALFILPGCVSHDKVWHYLLSDAQGKYYLNSKTISVDGKIVHAELRRELEKVRYDGAKYVIITIDMIPAERLARFRSITNYKADGKEIKSFSFDILTGRDVPVNVDWHFLPLETDLSKVAQAVADYCAAQGLKVETRLAPFISADLTYVGDTPNTYLFFRPTSVCAKDDYLSFDILAFFFTETAGSKYVQSTMEVDVPARQYRELNRKWYDSDGSQLGSDSGNQAFSPLPDMSPGGIILKSFLRYCAQNCIPVKQ